MILEVLWEREIHCSCWKIVTLTSNNSFSTELLFWGINIKWYLWIYYNFETINSADSFSLCQKYSSWRSSDCLVILNIQFCYQFQIFTSVISLVSYPESHYLTFHPLKSNLKPFWTCLILYICPLNLWES